MMIAMSTTSAITDQEELGFAHYYSAVCTPGCRAAVPYGVWDIV